MKNWTPEQLCDDENAPEDLLQILVSLLEEFKLMDGQWPRIVSLARHDCDEDEHWCAVLVELAPGVLLPTEHGWLEDFDRDEAEREIGGKAAAAVLEGVRACGPERLAALADVLHEARTEARRVLGSWQAEGINAGQIDVRLAPYAQWLSSELPELELLFDGFDDQLRSKVESRYALPQDVAEVLRPEKDDLRFCQDQRARLARQGANGSIDQIAINALSYFGDLATGLRRFSAERFFRLGSDQTAFHMRNGHVTAGNGPEEDDWRWNGDHISVRSKYVAAPLLAAAVGRPVTGLLDHPFLSDDIVVMEAKCEVRDGSPNLIVKVETPKHLFCSISGRVWAEAAEAAGTISSNIVPFLRRGR